MVRRPERAGYKNHAKTGYDRSLHLLASGDNHGRLRDNINDDPWKRMDRTLDEYV